MEDLDFTRSTKNGIYDPAVARMCFEALGSAESLAEGTPFFLENQRSDKMYLLLEGDVSLTRGKKALDIVRQGEIFGEIAAITRQPRSATAIARTPCRVISLDTGRFQRAIQNTPEFGLMLMNIMISRLRVTDAISRVNRTLPDWNRPDSRLFDDDHLSRLAQAFSDREPVFCPLNQVIMNEGEGGVFMYVVLDGRVAISIQSSLIERVGPGGLFGEMALVDQSRRAASAVAITDCSLLAINRNDFLALVKTKPEFGESMLKAIAERLRYMVSSQP
jgi:CRP/FNR family transcriptional regulator, cyclic AMP receptor protein